MPLVCCAFARSGVVIRQRDQEAAEDIGQDSGVYVCDGAVQSRAICLCMLIQPFDRGQVAAKRATCQLRPAHRLPDSRPVAWDPKVIYQKPTAERDWDVVPGKHDPAHGQPRKKPARRCRDEARLEG